MAVKCLMDPSRSDLRAARHVHSQRVSRLSGRLLMASIGAAALFTVAGIVNGCATADCNDTATCPIVRDDAILASDGALETNADVVGIADRAGDGTDETLDTSDGSFETAPDANGAAVDANDAIADGPPAIVADADGGPDASIKAEASAPKCLSNVLTPTRATASSVNNSNVPANAIDRDFATRWESTQGIDPQWIYLDFSVPVFVNRVQIAWQRSCGANYDLQVSNDAMTWTTMRSIVGNMTGSGSATDWTTAVDHQGLVGVGRYLRVNGTARCTSYGYSIWEMQVSGDTNTTCGP
jgi:hypothetical protein